ncbi:MAG TPA: hypothetical protein VGH67_15000 [Solirubrobacteraceae bacterium]
MVVPARDGIGRSTDLVHATVVDPHVVDPHVFDPHVVVAARHPHQL